MPIPQPRAILSDVLRPPPPPLSGLEVVEAASKTIEPEELVEEVEDDSLDADVGTAAESPNVAAEATKPISSEFVVYTASM